MGSIIIFIALIVWLFLRVKIARSRLYKWGQENEYEINYKQYKFFFWGTDRNVIVFQIVYYVEFSKSNGFKDRGYVIIGHWLWGLTENAITFSKDSLV